MIDANLPVLIVLAPLLTAITTALLLRRPPLLGWLAATLATGASCVLSITALVRVMESGTVISYALGDWRPPWGIEYRIDAANGWMLVIVSVISFVVTFFARHNTNREIPRDRHHFFWAVWLLCITGLLGITVTGDAFNVYVLLEISSLATYTLVAMGHTQNRRALPAAMNYLVLGTIGASFILLGIGYLYMATGTLNMEDIAITLRDPAIWQERQATLAVAVALLIIGFAIKLALFPLHLWLPSAYTYAPSAVSALLAATATKVGAYVTLRFLYTIIGPQISFFYLRTDVFLIFFASVAIIVAAIVAMRQKNVKRLLAWSSIGQVGYIVLGFALLDEAGLPSHDGLTGSLIHLFNHAITKGGMFLALACVAFRVGGTDLDHLRGLGRRMPFTAAAFTAGGLGLIGVPCTAGFVSKWYLVGGAFETGLIAPAFIILLGSVLAVIYVWRVVEVMYFGQPTNEAARSAKEAPLSMIIPMWILIGASIVFGIWAEQTGHVAETAARALLEVTHVTSNSGGTP